MEFDVQESRTASHRRRCGFLAFGESPEKGILVVNKSSGIGKLRHVAQHAAPILCCEKRRYRLLGKKVGYVYLT